MTFFLSLCPLFLSYQFWMHERRRLTPSDALTLSRPYRITPAAATLLRLLCQLPPPTSVLLSTWYQHHKKLEWHISLTPDSSQTDPLLPPHQSPRTSPAHSFPSLHKPQSTATTTRRYHQKS